MLTDIFSTLDPATNSFMNYNLTMYMFWMVNFMFIFMISTSYWAIPNRMFNLSALLSSIMYYQASRTTGKSLKSFPGILSALFLMIILMNLHGLIPYSFSVTSHLIFTLVFGLTFWLSIILSSTMFSPIKFLGALLPGGAPDWLNPFLVLIETISTAVRPITLSFRLAANMSAGHIVLSLMGIYSASALFSSLPLAVLLVATQMGYMLFEVGICLVQAYIFTLLISLYANDHS